MEIAAPSSFYLNCLSTTGLPEKMTFEIYDGETLVETIDMVDFSYTNSVNGPNKSFTFNNGTVTTVDAEIVTDEDGTTHFAEGAVLTFIAEHSDAATPVMDGLALTCAVSVSEGWGGTTTYFLEGSAALDGTGFDFAASSGGSGSGGPPPM